MRIWIFVVLVGVMLSSAPLAQAATASAEAVLKAVAGARREGLCVDRATTLSEDCQKVTTTCEGSGGQTWANYVERKWESLRGSVQLRPQGPVTITEVDVTSHQTITRTAPAVSTSLDEFEYLRADWERNRAAAPGPVQTSPCYCACGTDDAADACRGKPDGFPVRFGNGLVTDEECVASCAPRGVADKCRAQPVVPGAAGNPAAVTTAFDIDAFCFTPAECGEQKGIFEEHEDCRGKGRCYAAEPAITLQVPIGEVEQVQGLSRYILAAYRYGLSIVAVAATVMFVYGAFLYLLGSALPSLSHGKQYMIDALLGMIFVFAATMILRTINPALTVLDPLKVYMVNNRQFLSMAQCRDLNAQARLALAGVRPALTPYATVAAQPDAFKVRPTEADCGTTYWIDAGTAQEGASCEGTRCPDAGDVCVSCSDSDTSGCGGIATDRRVCVRTVFGGTIDFVDGKYPTGVDLMAVCQLTQDDQDTELVAVAMTSLARTKPERVGRRAGAATTDDDAVGRASYVFDLTTEDLQDAMDYCNDYSGFRGAVLAVVYKESFSSTGATVDDVAVLSPSHCGAGALGGYADGTRGELFGDEDDIASALVCGRRKGAFQATSDYWTFDQLAAAAQGGQPLTCDFTLSVANAPDDPHAQMCR